MNIEQVLRAYRTTVSNSSKLRKIFNDPKGYADLRTYAKETGINLAEAMSKYGDLENLSEDELYELFDVCLQANHGDVMEVAKKVQRAIYDDAGVGIGVLIPDYDREATRVLIESLIDGRESLDNLKNLVIKESLKNSDNTIIENSRAAKNMGLETKIIRVYDDVGLRRGTKYAEPCEWCLSRAGEWDNYADAVAAGAFERHPGCACLIDYKVGKKHTWSRQAGVWNDY